MNQKLKVYVISVMAFMAIDDALELSFLTGADAEGVTTYVEHLPAIVPAFSIKEAADAEKVALEKWKTSDGWYGHQAAIMPTTKHFYDAAFQDYKAGVVDTFDESEPGECFSF